MTDESTGRIFINYRRQDTAWQAVALYHRLAERFGEEQIFKDVDNIRLGEDFTKKITEEVESCDILLALIGKGWLDASDDDGTRRLDDPDDFVRLEIEAALNRDVLLIPILVDGASMPAPDTVPASIGPLVRRQALELNPNRFSGDTDELLEVLESTLVDLGFQLEQGLPADSKPGARRKAVRSRAAEAPAAGARRARHTAKAASSLVGRKGLIAGIAALVLVVAGALTWLVLDSDETPTNVAPDDSAQSSDGPETSDSSARGGKLGTLDDPLPIKTKVRLGDWEVKISSLTLDATRAVLADEAHERPKAGYQYVVFGVDATYKGQRSGDVYQDVDWAIIGSKGNTFAAGGAEFCYLAPDLPSVGETFPGGKVSGNLCIPAARNQLDGSVFKLQEFAGETQAFFRMD